MAQSKISLNGCPLCANGIWRSGEKVINITLVPMELAACLS